MRENTDRNNAEYGHFLRSVSFSIILIYTFLTRALFLLTVCSCHVTYAFQNESTLYICLNVKELLVRNRRDIWSLSDCNGTRTHNHLVCKRTLNHLAKLVKWLSCVVSTFLDGAFDCMCLSCHVRISEWTHTLYLLECQGTPCSKQARLSEV